MLRNTLSLVTAGALLLTSALALTGCGPTLAQIDPKEVVNVTVRPASGQLLYCPGDSFQVEVVAKLKDGTSCSNIDEKKGCKKETDMVIAPELVKITGSNGRQTGDAEKFIWSPDADFLKTADTGITLKAWLESSATGAPVKSMDAEVSLKPVYDCLKMETTFNGATGSRPGDNGSTGPTVQIAVTKLSTPFYPDAALIRIDVGANRVYMLSPSSDKPVRILAAGGPGAQGPKGQNGKDGIAGKDATEECAIGGDGGNGSPGLGGGKGGNGGPGGIIKVLLDETHADKLKGRLLLATPGGAPGPAGLGGIGGFGGHPGSGGPLKAGDPNCKPASGKMGKAAENGPQGTPGLAGPTGPEPTFETSQRNKLFANELAIIERIEGAKAK